MVVLLDCQNSIELNNLKAFALTVLCGMLEIFESDLTTDEKLRLDTIVRDWVSK